MSHAEEDQGDEDYEEGDREITCCCGERGTAADLFDTAVFRRGGCGGSGVLTCYCGGDFCVCHHHGTVECPGCEDCEPEDDDGFEYLWDDCDYQFGG